MFAFVLQSLAMFDNNRSTILFGYCSKRIFILGPSHHFYSRRCHISPATHYSTPMGPIQIDEDVYRQLDASGHFHLMTKAEDEAEHSLELHLPYIVHRMKGQQFTIVPIVVGALSAKEEATYGALLASYFQDPDNFFVISSDFCHWGARFSYTFWEREHGEIYESIENLDRQGMKIIEQVDPEAFSTYLSKTQNTICGRHPIGVFLNLLTHNKDRRPQITFTKYDQSSRCKSLRDSSVSYAAAVVTVSEENLEMEEDVGSAIA